ncbi:MAG: HxsD-like protein [Candidatus Portnoybacteria bacterium]|nr:HxsD-like protein [Candidatus Portnoybacteria bacterium]MDD4982844.1 HxsD-like protein [Candidatus Portnoybacteria bacterium]
MPKEKNSADINFNKRFYSLKAIKMASREFKDLADFSVVDGKGYIKVLLRNIDPEMAGAVEQEFCNYVLGLMK